MIDWKFEEYTDKQKADYLYDTEGLNDVVEARDAFIDIWGEEEYKRIKDSIEYETRQGKVYA